MKATVTLSCGHTYIDDLPMGEFTPGELKPCHDCRTSGKVYTTMAHWDFNDREVEVKAVVDKHPISEGREDRDTICWREHDGVLCIRPEGHAPIETETLRDRVHHRIVSISNQRGGWSSRDMTRAILREVYDDLADAPRIASVLGGAVLWNTIETTFEGIDE